MALPGTAIGTVYIVRDGQSLKFFCSPVGNPLKPERVLTVVSDPAVMLTSIADPVPRLVTLEGPWSISPKSQVPYVTYRLPTSVLPTDVLTYTAADGWLTTASGPAVGVVDAPVANYVGQLEPPVYGYLPFDQPPSNRKLKVGVNWSAPTSSSDQIYNVTANWMRRAQNPWKGALTSTPDGRPLTFRGSISTAISFNPQSNAVDASGSPTQTGIWTFIADETNPANPLAVEVTVNSNGTATLVNSGGGVWQYDVQRKSDAKMNLSLGVLVKTNQPGIVNYTLQNECLFSPVETAAALPGLPSRVNPDRPDAQVRQWCTTPSGKSVAIIRQMDSCYGYGGVSNVVDETDIASESEYSWALRPLDIGGAARTVDIIEVRTYCPTAANVFPASWGVTWTSPDVLVNAPSPATFNPADPGFLNWGGSANTQWYAVECRTSKPHGLKFGQYLKYSSGISTFPVSNGNNPPFMGNLNGLSDQTIFPTGADTFVVSVFAGKVTPGSGAALPGGMNNVIGSNPVAYKFMMKCPDSGTTPPEVAARAVASFSGAIGWANVPLGATYACSAELARRWRDNTTPGGELLVEYSNEPWNFNYNKSYLFALLKLGVPGTSPRGVAETYTHVAAHHHRIWRDVFNEKGRGNEIVPYFNVQGVAGGYVSAVVKEVNLYNSTNPPDPIPIGAAGPAPYVNMANEMLVPIASLVANNPLSIQAGKPTTWTRAGILDEFRHWLKYNLPWNGPTGVFAVQKSILATYKPVAGQPVGYVPRLIGYEGGIQNLVPGPIATGPDAANCYLQAQVSADLDGCPEVADVMNAHLQMCEQGGVEAIALFNMCGIPFGMGNMAGTAMWGLSRWPGQQPGYGTDSQYWADDAKFHAFNKSPRLMKVREWIDATSPGPIDPPPPPIPITPVITWADPADIVEGTALDSAQLNAVADVPGVFTYSPVAGTVLPLGDAQALAVTFAPLDPVHYTAAAAVAHINVLAAPPPPVQLTPVITWNNPADITQGTPLDATQLNALANVAGVFAYTPDVGTVLDVGSHILSTLFTPLDTVHYTTAAAAVQINVWPAQPPPGLPPLKPVTDTQRLLWAQGLHELIDWLGGQ